MNYTEKWIDIIVGTTLPTLDMFVEFKNGDSAFFLFFQYLRQARIQDTKETYSLDRFMMKRVWWSEGKYRKAKKILLDLWMIRTIKKRDEKWRVVGHYVGIEHKYRLRGKPIPSNLPVVVKTQSLQKPSPSKKGVQNAPVDISLNAPIEKNINAPVVLTQKDIFDRKEAMRIVRWFWEERKDEPINIHRAKKKWESKFKNDWLDSLLDLKRLDGFDWVTIELVLRFALQDYKFWRKNVVSLSGLRKKMKSGVPKFVGVLQDAKWYIEENVEKNKKSGSGRKFTAV